MIFSQFFRTKKPKQFSYKPRYYDERKDRMDELKEQIRKVNGEDAASAPQASRIRDGFAFARHKKSRNYSKASNARILIIAVALTALVYVLIYA